MMKRLLLSLTLILSEPLATECWSSGGVPIRSSFLATTSSGSLSRRRRHRFQLPPTQTSTSLRAENDNNDATVLYNDDAFGLIFLTSILVGNDYTFAACFVIISFLAVILVQFASVEFNPLFPGIVAISSLVVKSVVGNVVSDAVPTDTAFPVELGTSIVSLVWGVIQASRSDND